MPIQVRLVPSFILFAEVAIMSIDEQLLEAGAWLPTKTKADEDTVESISARKYAHPALPDRVIVQVTAERTGVAEDRALDVFGFQLEGTSEPLGIRRRRPMDFAGWALVTDPQHAAYALNLVKRMQRAGRKAKSKPGHAWDAYTEMATELDRSACHFLPAYWEEVGLTYRGLGNETYAGRSLSKAMEAERVHALPVDMKRRSDMVLEFALSGCLTIKALGDFAKDLQNLVEPPQAYETFADLAVRRTWGGLPPWNDLFAQLKRLAKAADIKPDQAIYDFVRQTIDAPSIEKASITFWQQAKKAVARLLEENPQHAQRLLDLRSDRELVTWGNRMDDELSWLDLLQEWEILQHVWQTDVDANLRPADGPGAWVGRLLRGSVSNTNERFWDLLQKVTPELTADNDFQLVLTSSGQSTWRSFLSLNVVEYCLKNKVPIAEVSSNYKFNMDAWVNDVTKHPARTVDPELTADSEEFGELLRTSINNVAAKPEFQTQAFKFPVVNRLFREWLDRNIGQLCNGAVPSLSLIHI